MEIRVQATERAINPEELRSLIPPKKLEALTGKGEIRAYTLAHEGTTHPRSIGEGTRTFKWPRKVIEQLKEIVSPGTKFYAGHNADNSTDGRPAVGEVITTKTKEIAGKLHNIVVGFFPKEANTADLDVISMEANIEVDPRDETLVDRITKFTGIAAASSDKESPAFPGARFQAALQCFEEKKDNPGDGKVTFEEVKTAIKEMNIFPHQLYEVEDIKSDRKLGKVYSDLAKLDADVERLTKENEELEKSGNDATRTVAIAESGKILAEILKDGYTDNQKKFIEGRWKPESLEELDESSVKKFVDETTKEFADVAKLFGADNPDSSGSGDDEGGSTTSTDDPVEAALKQMEE